MDSAVKAVKIWTDMNESEKKGVMFGLFPADRMKDAATEGYKPREISLHLIDIARRYNRKRGN